MLKRIIKISDKSFDDLNAEEVALMIEADSSLSPKGNDYFSACALDEFLYSENIKRKDLRELQGYILSRIYLAKGDSKDKDIDTGFLRSLAAHIRSSGRVHPVDF